MSKTLEEKVARSPLPKKDGRKKRRVAKPLPQEDTNSAPKTIDTILFMGGNSKNGALATPA